LECFDFDIPTLPWVVIGWELWVKEFKIYGGCISDTSTSAELLGEGRGIDDNRGLSNSKAQDLHGWGSVSCGHGWEPAEGLVPGKGEFDMQGSWKEMKSERTGEGYILKDEDGNIVSSNHACLVTKTRCVVVSKHWNLL